MIWNGDAFHYANRYLPDNLSNLKLCRKCWQLYGPIRLEDGQLAEQKCECTRCTEDEQWVVSGRGLDGFDHAQQKCWYDIIRDEKRYPGSSRYKYDFNKSYEICYCCGLEIIPSGSRWSLFYCVDCKQRIRRVNELVRKCMIPYGRHSMMNGVSLKGEAAENPKAVAEFTAAVNEMNRRIGGIGTHTTRIAGKQVERFQLGMDEPISALVLRSHGVDRNELKREAFIELIALVFGRTVDEATRFYEKVYGQ